MLIMQRSLDERHQVIVRSWLLSNRQMSQKLRLFLLDVELGKFKNMSELTNEKLVKATGMGLRTVTRLVAEMEIFGLVVREKIRLESGKFTHKTYFVENPRLNPGYDNENLEIYWEGIDLPQIELDFSIFHHTPNLATGECLPHANSVHRLPLEKDTHHTPTLATGSAVADPSLPISINNNNNRIAFIQDWIKTGMTDDLLPEEVDLINQYVSALNQIISMRMNILVLNDSQRKTIGAFILTPDLEPVDLIQQYSTDSGWWKTESVQWKRSKAMPRTINTIKSTIGYALAHKMGERKDIKPSSHNPEVDRMWEFTKNWIVKPSPIEDMRLRRAIVSVGESNLKRMTPATEGSLKKQFEAAYVSTTD